jgi:hypothetical protein
MCATPGCRFCTDPLSALGSPKERRTRRRPPADHRGFRCATESAPNPCCGRNAISGGSGCSVLAMSTSCLISAVMSCQTVTSKNTLCPGTTIADSAKRGEQPRRSAISYGALANRRRLSPDDKTASTLGRTATSFGWAAAPKFLSTNSAGEFPQTTTDDSAPRRMREIQCSSRS